MPIQYQGYLIIDLLNIEWALRDEDMDDVTAILTTARYYFREKTAFLVPENGTGISNNLLNSAIEREGIIFADFYSLDDAIHWLKTPGI